MARCVQAARARWKVQVLRLNGLSWIWRMRDDWKNRSPTWDGVCFKMVLRWGEVCNDLMVIAVSGSIDDMDLSSKRPWVLQKLVNLGRNPADRQKSWTTWYGQVMGFVLLAIRFRLSPVEGVFPGRWSDPFMPFLDVQVCKNDRLLQKPTRSPNKVLQNEVFAGRTTRVFRVSRRHRCHNP